MRSSLTVPLSSSSLAKFERPIQSLMSLISESESVQARPEHEPGQPGPTSAPLMYRRILLLVSSITTATCVDAPVGKAAVPESVIALADDFLYQTAGTPEPPLGLKNR